MRARPKLTVGVDVDVDDGVELSLDHTPYMHGTYLYVCMCVTFD